MRLFRSLVIFLIAVAVVLIAVLAGGSLTSLDWARRHAAETAALPLLAPDTRDGIVRIPANGFEFRARVAGLGNSGPGVVMLHGFPETSAMWTPLIELLADQGFRVVAFDQRGYSPGARPKGDDAYVLPNLVSDVFAVATAVGFEQFHLIGHDWGAAVGWAAVATQPQSLRSFTSLSIPHIAAFSRALENDPDQRKRSSYMLLFRTPLLPEALLTFNDLRLMKDTLYRTMSDAQRAEYLSVFSEPGALTAALNWYRAPSGAAVAPMPKVELPVLFIWGNQDPAVGRAAVDAQKEFIAGRLDSYELNAGHWLMEEATDKVDSPVLTFLQSVDQAQSAAPRSIDQAPPPSPDQTVDQTVPAAP